MVQKSIFERSPLKKITENILRTAIRPFRNRGWTTYYPVWFLKRLYVKVYSIFRPEFMMLHQYKLCLDPFDSLEFVSRGETYEKETVSLIKQIVKNGDIIIDIGAHIGYFSFLAATLAGREGRVFAFEANPELFHFLKEGIKANGFSRITAVNRAVTASSFKKAKLFLSDATSSLYSGGRRWVEVETVALDDFFRDKTHAISLIKMDIEGAEMEALMGMRDLLGKNPDALLITEFSPEHLQKAAVSPREYLRALVALGFRLWTVSVRMEEFTDRIEDQNLFSYLKRNEVLNVLCSRLDKKFRGQV